MQDTCISIALCSGQNRNLVSMSKSNTGFYYLKDALPRRVQQDNTFSVTVGIGLEQRGVDHREQRYVGADTNRQGGDRGDGETGPARERASGMT